ncbi:MAG: xanthine dehydrogenase small subunit, partial [Pseudomonadota bacterium]
MAAADVIRFVLDGEVVKARDVDPTRTVLQFLREDLSRKGTKEGCAEGDCGACTVVVADAHGEMRAINSCIQFLPTLDGKQLFTVESLANGKQLHPVQAAMVRNHGSQCGFCTPGFVMSLFALYETNPKPTRIEIDDALAGNLCRCTGYRPIVSAALEMQSLDGESPAVERDQLAALGRDEMLAIEHDGRRFFAPRTVAEFATVYGEHPDATILAGGTDVGLWVTKQHRELATVIYTGQVADMQRIDIAAGHIDFGAAVSLTDVMPVMMEHYPGLEEILRRFASPPIRNAGTLGGNIANGSPIGDSMAALMVIDATLILRSGDGEREVSIGDFYHDYMVNDLQAGEFLLKIRMPLPQGDAIVRSHKWSKRLDQDISAVCTAYRLELDAGQV